MKSEMCLKNSEALIPSTGKEKKKRVPTKGLNHNQTKSLILPPMKTFNISKKTKEGGDFALFDLFKFQFITFRK